MERRFDLGSPANSVAPELELLTAVLKQGTVELSTNLDSARGIIASDTPDLRTRIEDLSGRTEELQIAAQAALTRFPNREIIRNIHETQQSLNNEIYRACSVIRQDANLQNIGSSAGRERARDADDALALLREPPVLAEAALRDATGARSETEQSRSLLSAVAQQDRLARTLHLLGKHFETLERGVPESTRVGLRQSEESLGVKSELDRIYQRSDLYQEDVRSPGNLISELEHDLKNNLMMRQELGSISENIVARSESVFFGLASNEQSIGQQLSDLSKRIVTQQAVSREQASRLSDEVRSAATTELPRLSQNIKNDSTSTAGGIDSVANILKSAADQITVEIVQSPMEGASRLKAAAQEIENAIGKFAAVEKDFANVKAAAKNSEQTSLATLNESQTALQKTKTNLETAKTEISNIKAQQEKFNTEELQHKLEQAEAAYSVAQAQTKDALAATELASNNAKMSAESSLRIAKLDEQIQEVIERTTQLARSIRNQSEVLEKIEQDLRVELAKIAAAEEPIAKRLEVAVADLSRALSHVRRLVVASSPDEKQQAPELSEKLRATMVSTEELVSKNIPAAQELIRDAALPASAQPAVEEVEKRFRDAAVRLSELRALSLVPERSRLKRDHDEHQRSEAESKWLARTLDQLEASRSDSSGRDQAAAEAERAMHSALQCRRASMAIKRAVAAHNQIKGNSMFEEKTSSIRSPGQAPNFSPPGDTGDQNWGKLPRKIVEDVFQAARDPVSPEYQAMVDSYFKAIAEKAKQGTP